MKSKKLIHELLHYLYSEREKIESTGDPIAQDLQKTYHLIGEEIQELLMRQFKQEYRQFSKHLEELLVCAPEFTNTENDDAV